MKRCPACDKTFSDAMKFCQTDGTLLVEDATPADPYKTVVGNQSDIASAIPPLDPFKTMVASPPQAGENDLLQLPEEPDLLRTKIIPHDELRAESKTSKAEDVPKLDLPPPAPYNPSAPLIEPKLAGQSDFAPAPPKAGEPSLSPPNFGDLSSSESDLPKSSETSLSEATTIIDMNSPSKKLTSPFDSKPFPTDFSTQSPYGDQDSKPIPSPFQDSMPPNYQLPSESPFDTPPFKEAEPMFGGERKQESSSQSTFQPPSPFGNAEPFNSPMQQTEWTPPPAPVSEWQNQDLGANTPFQPPPAASGQNQTLAIVSLVCGVLSIFCCGWMIPGIAAVVLGFIAKNKAEQNPNEYGGRGLALGGIITGGISLILGIIVIILYLFTGILAGIGNL